MYEEVICQMLKINLLCDAEVVGQIVEDRPCSCTRSGQIVEGRRILCKRLSRLSDADTFMIKRPNPKD